MSAIDDIIRVAESQIGCSDGAKYFDELGESDVGRVWESAVDGNVWEPGVYGWTEVA